MKYSIIIALFCVLFSFDGMCQEKVVERSQRKRPQWVGAAEKDYIIATAMDSDLEKAKNRILDDVRRQVISAVAENVKASSTSTVMQQTSNDEIVSFLDTYSSSMDTQSANVPYLQGISMSKASDYYWEKRKNKKTGEITYLYAVKYPFPSVELKKLAYEFEKRDKAMYDVVLRLKNNAGKVSSVSEINEAIAELDPVIAYFFDDVRRNEAKSVQQTYRRMYERINFRTVSSEQGKNVFALMLDGREIAVSQRLAVKSEYATQLNADIDGTKVIVTYNCDNCGYGEEAPVTVTFRLGNRYATYTFYAAADRVRPDIRPEGTMTLRATEKKGNTLSGVAIRMDVNSKYKGSYILNSVELTVPGVDGPMIVENIDKEFKEGRSIINITAEGPYDILERLNFRQNMLEGRMSVTLDDGQVDRIGFALPFRPNW